MTKPFNRKPPTTKEMRKLENDALRCAAGYAKADADAWQAIVETQARCEGGLLVSFPGYTGIMPFPAAAGSVQRFPEEYLLPPEVAGDEHIIVYFSKKDSAPYDVSVTGTYRVITLEFFRGAESVYICTLAGNTEPLPKEITPDFVSRIEINVTEDYYDE